MPPGFLLLCVPGVVVFCVHSWSEANGLACAVACASCHARRRWDSVRVFGPGLPCRSDIYRTYRTRIYTRTVPDPARSRRAIATSIVLCITKENIHFDGSIFLSNVLHLVLGCSRRIHSAATCCTRNSYVYMVFARAHHQGKAARHTEDARAVLRSIFACKPHAFRFGS